MKLLSSLIRTYFAIIQFSKANSCPNEWIKTNNKCYFISKTPLVWDEAREFCSKQNSQLFVINNQRELNNVLLYVPQKEFHFYWVGLNDLEKKHDFVWEDGRHTDINDKLFKPGQFDDLNSIHDGCVNFDAITGLLEAWECDDPSFYICEKSTHSTLFRYKN